MIKDNKASKYLLYAIGEIVLVVIGILIALQINDWSGAQKLERTNIMLMERMQEELQLNIDRLQYLDTEYHHKGEPYGYTPILARIDTGLIYVNEGLDKERITWILSKSSFYVSGRYNMSSSVYHEILNSGHFYSLGPKSLTNKIQHYYQLIDREEHYAASVNQEAESDWSKCDYGFNEMKAVFDFQGPDVVAEQLWYLDQQSKNYLDLKIAMRQSYVSTERNRRHAWTMIAEAEALKKALAVEIQSKQ
jgi:hypothetical protein